MAFDNTVTIVGNVTRDPELRFTQGGAAVANFGVAWNMKNRDGEESVSFFDVTCWRSLAENVAESITKGTRVVIYGRLDHRTWETQDGEKRSKVEVIADEVAPSLRWATSEVSRNEFRRDGEGTSLGGGTGDSPTSSGADPGREFPAEEEPF
ncbi:MAG: single-stranded DNA-binding protein [Actinomycetota bacterium]|nr:single-stranded DNA-binding protein [Actinomycetota bacterium]